MDSPVHHRVPRVMLFLCPSLQIDKLTPRGATTSKLLQVLYLLLVHVFVNSPTCKACLIPMGKMITL